MVRGFVTVVVVVAALGALAVWLWLRPLREGVVQGIGLWFGCTLFVVVVAMVWWPHSDAEHPHRHRWAIVVALVFSLAMAGFGLIVARDDRRPALRRVIDDVVAGQPITFEDETSWAYQPRYVGGLGNSDWSVCRTFVVTGPPGPVAEHATIALETAGVEVGEGSHQPGDDTPRYGEVRVEGARGDRLVVCVDEVDPANR
jgi:hypothetical protein